MKNYHTYHAQFDCLVGDSIRTVKLILGSENWHRAIKQIRENWEVKGDVRLIQLT